MPIKFAITGDNSGFLTSMEGVRSGVRSTMHDVEKSGMGVEQMFDRLKRAAALSFAGFEAKELIGDVMKVRGEFQQLEVAFKTMLGSEQRAMALMDQLVRTAATTPFDLKGVADGAKMLLAYGTEVENVNEMIVRLGDVAAGMSIQLSDLVYLYGTTMVQGRMFTQDLRQFQGRGIPIAEEIAKVLNVAKNEVPELVTAGKVTAEVFHQAFINMTDEGSKFGGLMAEQSKTIVGQISNIEDAVDMMFNDIGKQSEGAINVGLSGVSYLVENWQKVGEAVGVAAVAIGSYKAVMVAVNAVQRANNALMAESAVQQALATAAGHTLTAAQARQAAMEVMLTRVRQSLIVATKELAAATLLNPYAWAAAAITTLVVLTYKLATAEDAETVARRRANDEMQKFSDSLAEQKNKIQGYIQTLQDSTATDYDKAVAWEMLTKLAPTLTEKYSKAEVATMDLAQANRELNQQMNEEKFEYLQDKVDEYRKKLEETKASYLAVKDAIDAGVAVSGPTAATEADVEKAKTMYDEFVAKLVEMKRIKQQIIEDNKPLEIKIQEANDNLQAKEDIYKFYKRAADLAGDLKEAQDVAAGTIANTSIPKDYDRVADDVRSKYDSLVDDLEKEVEELRTQIAKSPADIRLQMALEEKQKVLDDIKNMKAGWEATGVTTIPLYFKIHYEDAENAVYNARGGSRKGMRFDAPTGRWVKEETTTPTKTAAQWKAEAYGNWKRAEQALTDYYTKKDEIDKETFDKKVEDLQADIDKAKKEYQKYGGSTAGRKGGTNEAAKRRAAALQEERRWQEQMDAVKKKIDEASGDVRVSSIRNEGERERAEQDEQHRRNILQIEEQADEMKKALYEHNKRVWENANKDGVYEDTEEGKAGWKNLSLSKEQEELIRLQIQNENAEYNRLVIKRYDDEARAMREFLKEYGTYEQQKLAITQEYEDKIRNASTEGEKQRLQSELSRKLGSAKADELSRGIDFSQIVSGVSDIVDGIARETYKRIQEYKGTDDYKYSKPESKQAIAELERMLVDKGAAGTVSPFDMASWKNIDQHVKSYEESLKRVSEASKRHEIAGRDLEKAQEAYNNAVRDGVVGFERSIAEDNLKIAQGNFSQTGADLQKEQKESEDAQGKVVSDFQQVDKGLQDFNTVLGQITSGSLSGFANGVAGLINSLTSKTGKAAEGLVGAIGSKAGGLIGAILQIIDALGDDPAKFIDEILSKVANVIEAVISQIPEIVASAVKGVGNIVGSIGKGIVNMFGLGGLFFGDTKPYEDALDKWQWVLDSWQETIDYQKKLMDKAYGEDAITVNEEMLETLRKTQQAAKEIAQGWLDSGAGLFSHSNRYNVNEGIKWQYIDDKELQKALNITKSKLGEIFSGIEIYGGDVYNLFDLDWKKLDELKNTNQQFWQSIHSEVQTYLDQIIEAGKAAEDAEDMFMEKMTTTTDENMFDDFLNSLYELADESDDVFGDIAENWQKMVNKMLVNNVVTQGFQEKIKGLYKQLSDAMSKRSKDGDNQAFMDVVNGVKETYDQYVKDAQEQIEALREAGLIAASGAAGASGQSASVQAMERITTDQAEELIGRMNAGQMLWQQGNDQRMLMISSLTTMQEIVSGGGRSLSELVSLQQTANSYLSTISDWSKKIYNGFTELMEQQITQLRSINA